MNTATIRHQPDPDDRFVRLAALASSQGGLITRTQALELRVREHHLRQRVRAGILVLVEPGLYRFAAAPVGRTQDLWAAVLGAGEGSAISHRTAAISIGTRQMSGEVVDVIVPAWRRRTPERAILHRTRRLPEDHLEREDGLPRTTAARTLIDLSEMQPITRVARILEEWLADRKVTVAQVRQVLADLGTPGRAGAAAVRDLLDGRVLGPEPGDSTDDATLGQLMSDRGLAVPVHNYLVLVDGEEVEMRVVAEVDAARLERSTAHPAA